MMFTRKLLSCQSKKAVYRRLSSTSQGTLTVYGFPLSQPTRSVLMLLKSEKIPYSFVLVNALKLETRKPEFLKINPNGMVPAIVDGDFHLSESAAIMQYICEKHSLNDWYPTDPKLRSMSVFWMHWHHSNSRLSTKTILRSRMFPKLVTEQQLATDKKAFTRALTYIETALHRNPFLVYEKPTIADLLIVTELDQLQKGAFDLQDYSQYPKITEWISRLGKTVPAYNEVYEPVPGIAKSFPLPVAKVTCVKLGPFKIDVEAKKDYFWCSCGRSKTQPFCDGSHKGTSFKPIKHTSIDAKAVFFCGCKQSKAGPLCDGSHKNLPEGSEGREFPVAHLTKTS